MKKPWPAMTIVVTIASLFVSCANVNQTTVQNIYVQDVELKGPVNESPVHITRNTKPHEWRIIPRVAITNTATLRGQVEGHTAVNRAGIFQVDTLRDNQGYIVGFEEPQGANVYGFRGKNLDWSLPGLTAALDFDYTFSRNFSIAFGFNYALVGQKDFWGFKGGIGLHGEGEAAAFRIDVGAHVQSLSYESKTVITTQTGTSRPEVVFFSDQGSDTRVNPYATLTVNSTRTDWPVNFFVQLAVNSQGLIDYKPREIDRVVERDLLGNQLITTDMRADKTVTFISVTPGVYFTVTPSMHVLVGAKVMRQTQLEDFSPEQVVFPVVQVDFTP